MAIITHVAFYVGWPKGWAAFSLAKDVWKETADKNDAKAQHQASMIFPIGKPNYAFAKYFVGQSYLAPISMKQVGVFNVTFPIGKPNYAFAKYFVGQSYLAPISMKQVGVFNVTFEPGCRNNWHIHHADKGGGQILICVAGRGYYQEWGKDAIEMNPGDCINIPVGVKHWHGAAQDSWFSHLAIEVPGENGFNEWLEPVSEEQYGVLNLK